jgi:hypothetical protein
MDRLGLWKSFYDQLLKIGVRSRDGMKGRDEQRKTPVLGGGGGGRLRLCSKYVIDHIYIFGF